MRLPNGIPIIAIPYCEVNEFKEIMPRQVYKRTWLIDIIPKTSIRGMCNGKPNRIVNGFYRVMRAILHHVNTEAINLDSGTTKTIEARTCTVEPVKGVLSQDTAEPQFSNSVVSNASFFSTEVQTYEFLSDRLRLNAQWTSNGNYSSVGVYFNVYSALPLLARSLVSVSVDQVVTYSIDFFEPWTKNFFLFWAGLWLDRNVSGLVDTSGATRDLNSGADTDFKGCGAQIAIGAGTNPFSFDDYTLTNMDVLPTDYVYKVGTNSSFILIAFISKYIPSSDITITEIGLVQKYKATDGNLYEYLICRMLLTEPITLIANKSNVLIVRILAM